MSSRPTTVEEELAKTPDLLRFILPFLPNDVIQVLRSCANCCIEPSSCPSVNCLMPELADRLRKSITIAHRGTKAESQSSRSVLGNTNDDQPTQHNTINSIQVYTDTFVSRRLPQRVGYSRASIRILYGIRSTGGWLHFIDLSKSNKTIMNSLDFGIEQQDNNELTRLRASLTSH